MFRPDSELTASSAKATLEAGLHAIEAGQREIDLSSLSAVDSAAVAVLLAWKRAAVSRGTTLVFASPPANLRSLARLYGVDELLHH